MIVARDAHVSYRVYASGKRMSARESLFSASALRGGRELKTIPALRGVTFTASEGETIGVIGHNGSGKSTLFRAMSGLIPTTQGTILARDRPVLLGVNAALVPELSGENNIKLGLLAMGFSPDEAAARVDEIADFAELNEFIYHPMRTYSSGMSARLQFAIASAKAHSILLIDEALAVGDRKFKVKSEARIRELRDSAGLVMIVSHSNASIKDTCERVLWIHKGELRADGPTDEVIEQYVEWTKHPGENAVGAASASAAKPSARPAQKVAQASAPTKPPVIDDRAHSADLDVAAELSPLEELLAAIAETAPPAEPVETEPELVSSEVYENPNQKVRRARYRRTARERARRRMIALGITLATIILAAGAGAAIAFLAYVAQPSSAPATVDLSAVTWSAGQPQVGGGATRDDDSSGWLD